MPVGFKAAAPPNNLININTIHDDIMSVMTTNITALGYDIKDPKDRKSISHNEVNYCLRQVYTALFKPEKPLYNNQHSKIDYNNIELLSVVINAFIDICVSLNKSLGIMSFSFMSGIDANTLALWGRDEKSNPARYRLINNLRECHKTAQISLLNDTPVGALAVANNDTETGLEWSRNQALTTASNAVFLIPSERINRLKLGAPDEIQETQEQ